MSIFLYIFFGLLGGILGGMGMGGGTLLIPLLTIFLNVAQKVAQGINLIAFIPMAIIAITIHLKNKLIHFKNLLFVIIPGAIFSIGFSFIASVLDNNVLRFLFGNFLILIAIYEAIELAFEIKNKKISKK